MSIEQEDQEAQDEKENLGWNLVWLWILLIQWRIDDWSKSKLLAYGKDDKVCNIDDLDILQHEYDCLFIDFEKLMSKCK